MQNEVLTESFLTHKCPEEHKLHPTVENSMLEMGSVLTAQQFNLIRESKPEVLKSQLCHHVNLIRVKI